METSSLYQLNEYIRRVFALNFPEPIWINCEISQIKDVRGNFYLDLVEQNDKEEVIAQASAVIWYKSFLFIKTKLGSLTSSLLQAGTHIKIKVTVEFNERYGYKLVIEDIDPTYTMGRLELARQKIIERLKMEDVWDKNKTKYPPTVIQRIALISSEKAAGYADFVSQLANNPYGYKFEVKLFTASLQGQNTERDVCNALDEINENAELYDCIFIIRGGGSKIDLSYFDNFNIGYKICASNLPVITGIGHEIDESIADMAAFEALKTPTACAAWIIDFAANYEASLMDAFATIQTILKIKLERNHAFLEQASVFILQKPKDILDKHKTSLSNQEVMLKALSGFKLKSASDFLIQAEKITELVDPSKVLKKGYAIIYQNNKIITVKSGYNIDKDTTITFQDGDVIIKQKQI